MNVLYNRTPWGTDISRSLRRRINDNWIVLAHLDTQQLPVHCDLFVLDHGDSLTMKESDRAQLHRRGAPHKGL